MHCSDVCHLLVQLRTASSRRAASSSASCICASATPRTTTTPHPLDLLVYLDMNSGRVLDTWMYPDPPAIPQMKANYIAPLVQKERGFRTGAAISLCQSKIQDYVHLGSRGLPSRRAACSPRPEDGQTDRL